MTQNQVSASSITLIRDIPGKRVGRGVQLGPSTDLLLHIVRPGIRSFCIPRRQSQTISSPNCQKTACPGTTSAMKELCIAIATLLRQRSPPAACSSWLRSREIRIRRRHIEVRQSASRSEEHTSELQSPDHLVCRLLLEKKKKKNKINTKNVHRICIS